ncbi:ISAzo13-like element transposase-related protein [Vineibacter terrae]|uniref:ISAzo13-like element transposase-related protein n=1 Tax=Vineibacter terrae TaxID=2586908 RepID=UPI0039C96D57
MALLRVSRSQRHLAAAFGDQGVSSQPHRGQAPVEGHGFSLQANAKTREGNQRPDRNAQVEHINTSIGRFQRARPPAISVDTKKKELVGDFSRTPAANYGPRASPKPCPCMTSSSRATAEPGQALARATRRRRPLRPTIWRSRRSGFETSA